MLNITNTVRSTQISGCAVRVYRSDGSDGYTEGTYGYAVERDELGWVDGGYESETSALESASRKAREVA